MKTEKDVDGFLNDIWFDKRVDDGSWTTKELRQIIKVVIYEYFNKVVDAKFVIHVGTAIHQETVHDDLALMSATCILSDMVFQKFSKEYSSIDVAFRDALRFIE